MYLTVLIIATLLMTILIVRAMQPQQPNRVPVYIRQRRRTERRDY